MVALAISFFGSAWYTRLKYLASVSVSSQVEICRIAQLQENSECDGVEDSDPSNRNGDLMIDKVVLIYLISLVCGVVDRRSSSSLFFLPTFVQESHFFE